MSKSFRIVYVTNDSGYRFLRVAAYSVVRNADVRKPYEIVVVEGEGGVSLANKRDLESVIGGKTKLRFVDVDHMLAHVADRLTVTRNKSLMIWARCFLGELLPECDGNTLYLDTDTYVAGDLEEVFLTDLGDALAGMVPESGRGGTMLSRTFMPSELEFYCNAGMMLFNPAVWRRERIGTKLLEWGLRWDTAAFHDQDAVNAVFAGRIKVLPTKWNYHDGWVERSCRMKVGDAPWHGNDPRDVLEAIVAPRVLHYWGGRKPWKFNHRPERLCYECAMRELGMLGGTLEGTTPWRRFTLPFWDAVHAVMKEVALRRLRRLNAQDGR